MKKAIPTTEEYTIDSLIAVFDKMYPMREKISQAFNQFISNDENPYQFDFIRKDIAESWLRSRSYGLPIDIKLQNRKINPSTLKHILKENHLLIEVVKTILLKELAFLKQHSDFVVYLYDRHGIVLLAFDGNEDFNLNGSVGMDYSEKSIGTSSHSMSIFLNKPFLITPTENFNKYIQYVSAAISVPIHDLREHIIGVLTFVYPNTNDLYLANRGLLSGMVSFQMSIVKEVEQKLQLLTQKHALFRAVSSITNNSLIAINKFGEIQDMNHKAEKLFGASFDNMKGKKITDFLGKENQILTTWDKHLLTEDIQCHHGQENYTMRVVSFDQIDGALISLTQSKKISNNTCHPLHKKLNAMYTFPDIIGNSTELSNTKQLAKKFAATPRNILLLGESGTGKELFAQAIHNVSRPQGPFITINCASLPRGLVESEFFGFEAGTFTGADRRGRAGKLEMANGGTLFLDEIGDMPLGFQPILLRVLEDKRIMRIGGSHYIPANFRVIAATNKDLKELMAQNLFREDLYYRISSLKLLIPSLKNRKTDIPILVRHFIQRQCEEENIPLPTLETAIDNALISYDWPGNIRELQNAVCTALSLAEDGVIRVTDLPSEVIRNSNESLAQQEHLRTISEAEEQAIQNALYSTDYNIKKSAQILGISRPTLYQKLKEYNIYTKKNTLQKGGEHE
ncbi:sigma 54-interacting transcriptional regulator [Robertmurraya massiliosenegalensis]|uniref:sigma-54 interaction domain-containing protein n=1 Tax=Robertmurraya TaxID=2837507 RepID=UPI0039A780A5